jgi:hypothetical protein
LAFTRIATIILQLPSAVYFILFLVRFVIDKLALGQSSLRVFGFPYQYHSIIVPYLLLSSWRWTVCPLGARFHTGTVSLYCNKRICGTELKGNTEFATAHTHTHTHAHAHARARTAPRAHTHTHTTTLYSEIKKTQLLFHLFKVTLHNHIYYAHARVHIFKLNH